MRTDGSACRQAAETIIDERPTNQEHRGLDLLADQHLEHYTRDAGVNCGTVVRSEQLQLASDDLRTQECGEEQQLSENAASQLVLQIQLVLCQLGNAAATSQQAGQPEASNAQVSHLFRIVIGSRYSRATPATTCKEEHTAVKAAHSRKATRLCGAHVLKDSACVRVVSFASAVHGDSSAGWLRDFRLLCPTPAFCDERDIAAVAAAASDPATTGISCWARGVGGGVRVCLYSDRRCSRIISEFPRKRDLRHEPIQTSNEHQTRRKPQTKSR
jgi:hypothetical protein